MLPTQPARTARGKILAHRRLAAALLVVVMIGCSGRASNPAIVPDSSKARRVLEEAMAAWKGGRPVAMLDATGPRVQVIDSFRKPGQALEGYEILGESATPRVRTFSLRLRLSGTDERPVVRYLLVGIDPVLVFREEDYEMLSHFEHKMDPEAGRDGDGVEPPGPAQ